MTRVCSMCHKTQPSFGTPGGKAVRCGAETCRQPGDVNVTHTMCSVCHKTRPSFGPPGGKAVRCGSEICRQPGDVDLKNTMCSVCNKTRPSLGPPGGKAVRCGSDTCRQPGDVNLNDTMCSVCNKTVPIFGPPHGKAVRCGACRQPGDVNLKNTRCSVCHETQPSFGPPGEKAVRCSSESCRQAGDVDLKNTMCSVCHKTQPTFGPPGGKRVRCRTCWQTGDVNLKNTMCSVCNKTRPSFGPPGGKCVRCGPCRQAGDVDVKNTMCNIEGCTMRACYGSLFASPTRCAKHATGGLLPKKLLNPKCTSDSCSERPCWTDQPNNHPLRCEDHKLVTDTNVLERPCSQCGFASFIREGSVCNTCCNFEVLKRNKSKELAVKALLEARQIQFVHDLRPEGGCGKARPDFAIDCGTHVLIIEVDEFQHRRSNYNCQCEQVRTINLFQEYGGLRVVFIRYNPDSYVALDGRKLKGSSAANQKRLMTLVAWSMANVPESPLTTRYLCYDQDNGKYDEFVIDYEAGLAEQMDALSLEVKVEQQSADRV